MAYALLRLHVSLPHLLQSGLGVVASGAGRFFEARKIFRGSISARSRRGLDALNFFLADIQTGFGAFVAFYLADLGWHKDQVGVALSAGMIAGLVTQLPGGAMVDWAPSKRGIAGLGIAMIGAAALIFALAPTSFMVVVAEILHGLSGSVVTPAVAAISLGLVGRSAMSARTGRNYGYKAAGNALTAGAMGAAGQYIAKSAIFFGTAALCVPALIALICIRGDEIDNARARNAGIGKSAANFQGLLDVGKNRQLYVFAACILLFQFADASMLPIVSQDLAHDKGQPDAVLLAGLIVTPQIVAAGLSPWVGYYSEKFGRKPLLLVGFIIEVARGLLFAAFPAYPVLVFGQLLSGVSAASITVLTVVVVADMTVGTGRFNLVQGFIGTTIAIGAAASVGASGFIFEHLGRLYGFLILSTASAAAAALLGAAMHETRPGKYLD
jgi:MFS family permease